MNLEALIRPTLHTLKPYRSARQDHVNGILLDANENSFGSVVTIDGIELNRYPDPYQHHLRAALALRTGVQEDNIFVGVGSDEVIDLLIRIFCTPASDSILIIAPTYGMYRVAAEIQDLRVEQCLLNDDFCLDVDAVRSVTSEQTKIIFCCSPNNPTGNLLRTKDIAALCMQSSCIVVVDEAYIEFSPEGSAVPLLQSFPNLVILRTLSKAWGMAGIRLGYCIADPFIISYLLKIKSPYNINALTGFLALKVLERQEQVQIFIASIIAERKRLMNALRRIPSIRRVFSSDANFFLIEIDDATAVHKKLVQKGIIVRDRSSEPKLSNCLRITVGTPEQNDALLTALREIV